MEKKKEKLMDSKDLSGNYVDICLFKPNCHYKRKRATEGKNKAEFRYCTFPDTCNQKRRTTIKQIVLDYLKSKNNHPISNLIKRVKDAISNHNS
jgi:hypothetical protein